MARSGIVWDDRAMINNLRTMNARSQGVLSTVVRRHAVDAEAWMKINAPWQDDTGNARGSLTATPEIAHPSYAIVLAHGADYGIWLEVANSGKYEIIRPTIEHEGALLMASVALLWATLLRGRGAT